MTAKTKETIKDIAVRAVKTFAQAFLSAVSVDALLGVTDLNTLKKIGLSMLIAGTAAGISALWNASLAALNSKAERAGE